MSAYLGPIHFWLYNKILFQEDLLDAIAAYAINNNWLTADEAATYTAADRRELSEAVDGANIHGWLQNRIHDGEGRYAALVTKLTSADTNRLDALKQVVFDFGRSSQTEVPATAPEAFHQLDNILLNGMPCDQVMKVIESNPDKVIWEETQDLHSQFWNGNGTYYYDLRAALIKGLLAGSTLFFTATGDNNYEISNKI